MKIIDLVSVLTGSELIHIKRYAPCELYFTGSSKELKASEEWDYLSDQDIQLIIAGGFGEQHIYVD